MVLARTPRLAGRGLKPGLAIVPADLLGETGGIAQFDQVGAAADHDVLRVHHLIQRGMQIGAGAAANVGAAFQHGDARAIAGQRYRCSQTGCACPDHHDVALGRAHPSTLFHAAIIAPRARIVSFSPVESPMRSRKTSILRSAMRPSSRW